MMSKDYELCVGIFLVFLGTILSIPVFASWVGRAINPIVSVYVEGNKVFTGNNYCVTLNTGILLHEVKIKKGFFCFVTDKLYVSRDIKIGEAE